MFVFQPKFDIIAYFISGFHHFYLGRIGWGFAYVFTLGFCGIGWIIDIFRLKSLVKKTNKSINNKNTPPKKMDIAYAMGMFPFTGMLGVHHFYLGNMFFGITYACTLGLLGIGYLVDWFRMPILVKRANNRLQLGIKTK